VTGPLTIRRLRVRRNTLILLATALILAVLYSIYLTSRNRYAQHYLAVLRQTGPTQYLEQLRKLKGFGRYLVEYSALNDYRTFRRQVPEFMAGRWTLRPHREQLPPTGYFSSCTDPISFEYGQITLGSGMQPFRARYRIAGAKLIVRTDTKTIPILLVSYGEAIDHLEFVPPTRKTIAYAYRCLQ